jgi:hypothetical protein
MFDEGARWDHELRGFKRYFDLWISLGSKGYSHRRRLKYQTSPVVAVIISPIQNA